MKLRLRSPLTTQTLSNQISTVAFVVSQHSNVLHCLFTMALHLALQQNGLPDPRSENVYTMVFALSSSTRSTASENSSSHQSDVLCPGDRVAMAAGSSGLVV